MKRKGHTKKNGFNPARDRILKLDKNKTYWRDKKEKN